jgi:hypothetical protein
MKSSPANPTHVVGEWGNAIHEDSEPGQLTRGLHDSIENEGQTEHQGC